MAGGVLLGDADGVAAGEGDLDLVPVEVELGQARVELRRVGLLEAEDALPAFGELDLRLVRRVGMLEVPKGGSRT